MTERRRPMTLNAHPNVVDMAEERRRREGELIDDLGFRMMFVGFVAREPETAPQAAPVARKRRGWLRTILGLARRSQPS